MTEQLYLITERELDQIKNDCAYPESESCVGCPLADGEDDTRASGMGCNFKGANALMEEVITRPAQQQPDALAEAYRMIESLIYSDCPPEDMCDPVCEKSCTECKEHALARLRSGRK